MYDLAEALIELDERTSVWRDVHVKMVQRVIGGGAIGTQGTPVAVLAGLTKSRLFPALWDVRNTLTEIARSSEPLTRPRAVAILDQIFVGQGER